METLTYVMTTTFYPPYHLGGDALHVQQLSRELAKRGHDVHVLHSIDAYRLKRNDRPKALSTADGVSVHPFKSPLGRISPFISYVVGSPFPIAEKMIQLVKDINPDVVHHHNISLLGPSILGVQSPIKLYTAHDYWLICPQSSLLRRGTSLCYGPHNCSVCSLLSRRPPQLWRYSNTLRKKLKNVDVIIAPSHFAKSVLEKNQVKGKLVVMPNFSREVSRTEAPRKRESPYFLYVGVFERHKGVMDLVTTFIEIDHSVRANLLIVGRGSLENEIRESIKKSSSEKDILLLGSLADPELANLYDQACAVVIPSTWHENCPLVALEALASGTPLIVSNNGGLPELVDEPELGFVYDNREELKSILLDFSKDEFNPNVIKKAAARYSPSRYVQNLLKNIA